MEADNQQLFEYVWIRLNGLPIFTTHSKLKEFISSITIGSSCHPTISLPHPKSCHLVRTTTDLTAHAMLKFDWTMGRSEEEADARLTEILEACDRLKLAELSLPTTVPTPKIEPILVCPTREIGLSDPTVFTSNLENQPIKLVSFSRYIRFSHHNNKQKKKSYSSQRFRPSLVDHGYNSPRDHSSKDRLNDVEFVRERYKIAKQKRITYLAAERLNRIRSMPYAERLKH